tara:strand:- start:24708 stop:25103 length:396 start_codon:yes stop_codon:yes gene_type:complete
MLNYVTQPPVTVFDNITLTSAYSGNVGTVLDVKGMSKVSIDVDYAQGASESGNICHFKLEHSTDGTNWYQLVIDDTNTVSDITAREWNITGDATLNLIVDIAYDKLRISARESGVASNAGTLTMVAMTSGL